MSALVDGQLDPEASERAWQHVLECPDCRRLVEREGWVKRRLAQMNSGEPPPHLMGSLRDLDAATGSTTGSSTGSARPSWEGLDAWAAVDELERRGRNRRRAGIALVGAGSVSVALLGFAGMGGLPLGVGDGTTGAPASSLTRATSTATPTRAVVAPAASVHGRIPRGAAAHATQGVQRSIATVDHP